MPPPRGAFTLAEVLITLGIIGVVAAITLPALIADYQDKRDVVKVKKAYSILQQAVLQAVEKHGDVETWQSTEEIRDYLKEAIVNNSNKKVRNIEYVKRVTLLGTPQVGIAENTTGFISIDNSEIFIYNLNGIVNGRVASIVVDINGDNPPNRFGFDTFGFVLLSNNTIATYHGTFKRCDPQKDTSTDAHPNGEYCTGWVILNENMDYKKCLKGSQKYCEIDYNLN